MKVALVILAMSGFFIGASGMGRGLEGCMRSSVQSFVAP